MRDALYRRYRPKKLSEIVGQEHIVTTLNNALENGSIRHAYLFTGPKGVGKTSVARILAHEINGLEYTDESAHLDIIEIDAASNRRIDEIRDLRDKVHITPTSSKYKVYIIDEVHMLTREAFNALLKTLEEPPEHAIFILATTELHKVPATIISRTQRFPFRQIAPDSLKRHLKIIAKKEKIDIDDDALDYLIEYGEGSARDSISLLDQISSGDGKITKTEVESTLGLPAKERIESLVSQLKYNDVKALIQTINDFRVEGVSASQAAAALSKKLRDELRSENTLPDEKVMNLLRELLLLPTYSDPMSAFEIALIDAASKNTSSLLNKIRDESTPQTAPQEAPEMPIEVAAVSVTQAKDHVPVINSAHTETSSTKSQQKIESQEFDWMKILNATKAAYGSLYGMLRMAEAKLNDEVLTLSFSFAFHAKQAANTKNISKLHNLISELGFSVKEIKIETTNTPPPLDLDADNNTPSQDIHPQNNELQNISNIFGGAELLD